MTRPPLCSRGRGGLCALSVALSLPSVAALCHPVYIALPEETLSDHIQASQAVILARPAEGNPFRYQAQTWLKGDPAAALPPIPHLVDSGSRRRLSQRATDAVVFVHRSDETGWQRLAYANAPVRAMMQEAVTALPEWTTDRDDPVRFAFFAARHANPDPTVRRIAIIEVSQAPYRLIRTLRPRMTFVELQALLRDPTQTPLTPIYVLMLGLIDDPRAGELVRETVAGSQRLGTGADRLAWATALIEIDGRAGVDRLAAMLLGDTLIARPTAEAAIAALGLHGTEGRVALREPVAAVMEKLVERDAALAAQAVHHLTVWEDWRAAPAAITHLRQGRSLALPERLALTAYVASAQRASLRAGD